MPEFVEVVRLQWDISQAETSAKQLDSILAALDKKIATDLPAASARMAGAMSSAFGQVVVAADRVVERMDMIILKAQEAIAAASAAGRVVPALGEIVSPQQASQVASALATYRWQQRRAGGGVGGGGGLEDDIPLGIGDTAWVERVLAQRNLDRILAQRATVPSRGAYLRGLEEVYTPTAAPRRLSAEETDRISMLQEIVPALSRGVRAGGIMDYRLRRRAGDVFGDVAAPRFEDMGLPPTPPFESMRRPPSGTVPQYPYQLGFFEQYNLQPPGRVPRPTQLPLFPIPQGGAVGQFETLAQQQAQQQAQMFAQAQAQAMALAQQRATVAPGAQFPYLQQQFLQQQLAQAGAQLGGLRTGYFQPQAGQPAISAQQVEQAATQVQALQQQITQLSGGVNLMSNVWIRHLFWIGQTILILGTLRIAYGFISEASQDVTALADASARLAAIQGGAAAAQRPGLLAGAVEAAAFGVAPREALAGGVLAARLDATPEMVRNAQQVSLVFGQAGDSGASFDNVLRELVQTELRATAAGLEHVAVMDTVAAIYAETGLDIEQTFDAIQAGVALYQQLGVTAEQAALAIAEASTAAETAPEVTAGRLARLAFLFQQPERLRELRGFGVTAETPREGIPQIAQIAQQLAVSGDIETAARFFQLITGGSLQARRDMQDMAVVLRAFNQALRESSVEAGGWQRLFGEVGNTIGTSLRILTTEAQAFIAVWSNTGGVEQFFDTLGRGIEGLTSRLRIASTTRLGMDLFAGLSPQEQLQRVEEFERASGFQAELRPRGIMPLSEEFFRQRIREGEQAQLPPPVFQAPPEVIAQMNQAAGTGALGDIYRLSGQARRDAERIAEAAFAQWLLGLNEGAQTAGMRQRPPNYRQVPFTIPEPSLPIGGIRALPEDFNTQNIQRRVNRLADVLAGIEGIDPEALKPERFVFIDTLTGALTEIVGPAQAVALALDQASASANRFGGFRDLPQGLPTSRAALQLAVDVQQRRVERLEPGRQDYEQILTFQVYDETNDRFIRLRGSAEALNLAFNRAADTVSRFGGFRDLPENVSLGQLTRQVGLWQRRVELAEPGRQPYEERQSFLFWDNATKSFRPIVTSQDALRYAMEELTRVQKQIAGVFNVPANAEVLIPFTALQEGLVPRDRLGQYTAEAGGDGVSVSGAALSGAAGAHMTAAQTLRNAGVVLGSAAGLWMSAAAFQQAFTRDQYYQPRPRAQPAPAMSSAAFMRAFTDDPYYQSRRPMTPGGAGARSDMIGVNVNIANRNVIMLDGRVIATALQQVQRTQLSQLRRTSTLAVNLVV